MPKVSRKKAPQSKDVVDSLGSPDKETKDQENKDSEPPSPTDSNAAVKKAPSPPKSSEDPPENDSFDIVLPAMLGTATSGECTLMVEVSPEDASMMDYEGIGGAIGRFEANHHGVIVDLKGNRYQGSILPGPTAMVVSLVKGGQLKAESITDEFVTLAKATNVMKSLDAVIKGELDEGFNVRDENVNKRASKQTAAAAAASKAEDDKKVTPKTKKRASVSSAKSSTKKKKKT